VGETGVGEGGSPTDLLTAEVALGRVAPQLGSPPTPWRANEGTSINTSNVS
jgi:hypothetical protein